MKTSAFLGWLLAGLVLATSALAQPGTRELSVHFINVGQGDCTLIVFPSGKRLLVDCGSTDGPFNAAEVRAYIKRRLDPANPRIDLLVITHPDADHYNKIPSVLGEAGSLAFEIGRIMLNGDFSSYGSAGMEDWLGEFPAERIDRIDSQEYNTYPSRPLPGFEADGVKVLAANVTSSFSASNTRSVVLKISFGNFDVMITGDATKDTDKKILELYAGREGELDVEVWKGAHHGSWATATQTRRWASAVQPEMIVFSCSATNDFGHPNRNLAETFKDYTVTVKRHRLALFDGKNKPTSLVHTKPFLTEAMYSTASSGNIVVRSNGQGFTTEFGRN